MRPSFILKTFLQVLIFSYQVFSQSAQWQELNINNSGLTSNRITTMIQDNNNNYWFGSSDKGLYKFDGEKWTTYDSTNSPIHSPISSLTIDQKGYLWVGTTNAFIDPKSYTAQGLLCFNGYEWKEYNLSNSEILSNVIYELVADKTDNLWMATQKGLQKYNGTVWKTFNFTKGASLDEAIRTIVVDSSNTIWCGTGQYNVNPSESDASGQLIHLVDTIYTSIDVPSTSNVTSLSVDTSGKIWIGMNQYILIRYFFGGGIASYKAGCFNYYSYATKEIPSNWITKVALDKDNTIWATSIRMRLGNFEYGRGGLVHYDGLNWTRYDSSNSPMKTEDLDWLYIDKKGNKFCGSIKGIYVFNKQGVNITSVRSENLSIPTSHLLEQNYPNPFNPTTTISFTLAKNDHAVIKIYNLLGQEVAKLVDGEYSGGIKNEIVFDASQFTSGVYFYRLIVNHKSVIKTMVLLK